MMYNVVTLEMRSAMKTDNDTGSNRISIYFDLSTIGLYKLNPFRKKIMNGARAPSSVKFIADLLRNMAARPDESVARTANKKRSWKAPDRGNSREETKLLGRPRDDSILQIDGSVLEGVGHVRPCDWIFRTLLRVGRYFVMQ